MMVIRWRYYRGATSTCLYIHLKSCFLYMATFKEDSDIRVLNLIRLWVAEGLLKPTSEITLEDVALEYLNDLADRNLIMVKKKYWNWKIEICSIHDSLREFCLRIAENEKFFCIIKNDTVDQMQRLESERRFVHHFSKYPGDENYPCLPSAPNARSMVFNWNIAPEFTSSSRFLRVLHCDRGVKWDIDTAQLVSFRHLVLYNAQRNQLQIQRLFSSISLAWNLETLVFTNARDVALPDPRADQINYALNNLQTLYGIRNFNCTDAVVKMTPNIRELRICYPSQSAKGGTENPSCIPMETLKHALEDPELSRCCQNMARLHKLEKLHIDGNFRCFTKDPENLMFSPSLRQLELHGSRIPWEHMTDVVGSLPSLEVLILKRNAAVGKEWNSVVGKFQRLKYLLIEYCDLTTWRVEGSHFPRVEKLRLANLPMEEIPWGIGEISSLESFMLETWKISTVISAKEMLDQREDEDGSGDLLVSVVYNVKSEKETKRVKELENDNFRVTVMYTLLFGPLNAQALLQMFTRQESG